MSVYDEVMEVFKKMDNFIFDLVEECNAEHEKRIRWLDETERNIEEFDKTGVFPENNGHGTMPQVESATELDHISSSLNPPESNKRITRQTKNTIILDEQQKDNFVNNVNNIQVKLERTTNVLKTVLSATSDLKIKEEMPPPQKPAVKNTRKKKNATATSVKVKSELLDDFTERGYLNGNRDSDVQIQNATLDIVVLDDSILEKESRPIRTTRARTKAKRKDKDESQSETEDKTTRRNQNKVIDENDTQSKTDKAEIQTNPLKTSRKSRNRKRNSKEDRAGNNEIHIKKRKVEEVINNVDVAITTTSSTEIPPRILNETHVISKPALLNETVVLEKPTLSEEPATINDIITDDEDIVDGSPIQLKQRQKTKAVFSPYENSPVKKRVQAFEKLGAAQVKVTSSGQKLKNIPRIFGTPLMENRQRHLQPSSASKLPIAAYNISSTASKVGSGFKSSTSQMEFRERELRRKQKEEEALQKKEAMILAQTEEKKRKREEREMKVQQQKMVMEKEKQKKMKISDSTKDEKSKHVLAEKETKLSKQKAEAAQKRAVAAKKAAELKQIKEVKSRKFVPPYLKYKTPLLPTTDCYDSDYSDDSSSKRQVHVSSWQKGSQIFETLRVMQYLAPHRKMLFLSGAKIPNLKEIFPSIEPSKLKRTSSAIWNKTEMSILENMTEEDED